MRYLHLNAFCSLYDVLLKYRSSIIWSNSGFHRFKIAAHTWINLVFEPRGIFAHCRKLQLKSTRAAGLYRQAYWYLILSSATLTNYLFVVSLDFIPAQCALVDRVMGNVKQLFDSEPKLEARRSSRLYAWRHILTYRLAVEIQYYHLTYCPWWIIGSSHCDILGCYAKTNFNN